MERKKKKEKKKKNIKKWTEQADRERERFTKTKHGNFISEQVYCKCADTLDKRKKICIASESWIYELARSALINLRVQIFSNELNPVYIFNLKC